MQPETKENVMKHTRLHTYSRAEFVKGSFKSFGGNNPIAGHFAVCDFACVTETRSKGNLSAMI
ncbi:hypothetical protein Z949_3428 [Sulfitobacter guttiformis KCTC 32187]|jgi:hypothetical protein|nr:hypothetical protein Z949_3428 [Sulfitobacter guttiformis KCTC 32187]